MLGATEAASARRRSLRAGLSSGRLLRFPGAFNALTARLIEEIGFDGVYVSGAAVAASLGLPDIGLTSVSEVATKAGEIAQASNLPVFVDADTGFGEPMNVARTIQQLEDIGASGCHLEDQVMPKRCGHLDGKTVVATEEMVRRIRAAVVARRDAEFVICARTDAVAIEGIDAAIGRSKAYVDAGAEMIFPEALTSEVDFAAFRAALDVPLLANMTEFGKSPLLSASTLESLGFNLVIYPVTLLRLAMGAVESGLREIFDAGTQAGLVDSMQTRARLYELLDYSSYSVFDGELFNFGSSATSSGNERNDGGS